MRPLYQTLIYHTNAFDMSRNTPQTSYSSSNNAEIPWVIDKSWFMQESSALKLNWFVEIRCYVMTNILLQNSRSNIFALLSWGDLQSLYANHCVTQSLPEGHRQPHNENGSLIPKRQLVGFESGSLNSIPTS